MGFLKGLFGQGDQDKNGTAGEKVKVAKTVPWLALNSISQLEEIVQRSKTKTQVIFKHSTTCGISRMVLKMFNSSYDFPEGYIDIYYLDLHAHRDVSNETGYLFQVIHQSPQLLVIRNGTVVAHASHGAISEVDIQKYA